MAVQESPARCEGARTAALNMAPEPRTDSPARGQAATGAPVIAQTYAGTS